MNGRDDMGDVYITKNKFSMRYAALFDDFRHGSFYVKSLLNNLQHLQCIYAIVFFISDVFG